MHALLGGLGTCSSKRLQKLDALRLLLRPFWDRCRAVVTVKAIWFAEYCIEFLAVHKNWIQYSASHIAFTVTTALHLSQNGLRSNLRAHFLRQLTSNFHGRRYCIQYTVGRTTGGWQMVKQYAENKNNYVRKPSRLYRRQQNVYRLYHAVGFHAFSERQWYDSRLFSYRFIVGGDSLQGQLVSPRAHEELRITQPVKPLTATRAFRAGPLSTNSHSCNH